MGPLQNLRWERFARERAVGTPLAVAYELAGFKPGPYSKFNASKLSWKPPVRQRINEICMKAAEDAVVQIGWVQHGLIEIIEGKAESSIRIDAEGKRVVEIDRQGALIALGRTLGAGVDSVTATAIAGASVSADADASPAEIWRTACFEAERAVHRLSADPLYRQQLMAVYRRIADGKEILPLEPDSLVRSAIRSLISVAKEIRQDRDALQSLVSLAREAAVAIEMEMMPPPPPAQAELAL